jgi:hypothetical protein
MNERDNRLIATFAVVVGFLLLFFMLSNKPKSNTIVNNQYDAKTPSASFGDIVLERRPFPLPNLGVTRNSATLQAIGACCTDCRPNAGLSNYAYASRPATNIIFNEGAKGPNVYNYFAPSPPVQSSKTYWWRRG